MEVIMRTKFTIDAEIKRTPNSEWEIVRFEQISTSEKLARRRVIDRATAAGFAQVGMQRTVARAHAL